MSALPCHDESTLTTSSGALVTMATAGSPTTSDETPYEVARRDAERTSHSPPTTSTTRPPANCKTLFQSIARQVEQNGASEASRTRAAATFVLEWMRGRARAI